MSRILIGVVAVLAVATLSLWVMLSRTSGQLALERISSDSLRATIAVNNGALKEYQERHKRDSASLASLDKKIIELENYVSSLPDGDARCLSADDTERLRGLWP